MDSKTKLFRSEFDCNCYDDSLLAWYVRDIVDNSYKFNDMDSSQLEEEIEYFFNESIVYGRKQLSDTKSFSRRCYFDFFEKDKIEFDVANIEISESDNKVKDVDISNRILNLYYYLMTFSAEKYPVYYAYAFRTLIEKFYQISAECVFHPGNANLNNLLFRKSSTLEALYCIGKIPFQESKEKREKGYAYYNVCSPYVAESFLRTVDNLVKIINVGSKDSFDCVPELKRLRTEIFINKMIRSFTRSTSYNQFTNYRVTLNRHNSELVSIPYNELSSIQEVKPIRLFEKIVSHIHLCIEELFTNSPEDASTIMDKELNVDIAVIGHTEVSYEGHNNPNKENEVTNNIDRIKEFREVNDLLHMVMHWYALIESQNISNLPKLILKLKYFVNSGDLIEAHHFDVHENNYGSAMPFYEYECNKYGNEGKVFVEKCNYYREFNFSKKKLKEIARDFSLVFVLDCPWLTTENYELMNDGGLDSYCNFLRQKNTIKIKNSFTLDYDKNTDMQYLDAQYNRITSSESVNSGLISRVFRDDYLRAIVDCLKNDFSYELKKQRKDFYVFTSEKDGVNYSYLGSYPLLRKELYGEKIFSIAHFSNTKSEPLHLLPKEKKPMLFIRLWSIFKYIAVSYVSVYYRKVIDDMLIGYDFCAEDFFELMRSIVVKLELSNDLNKVSISLGFDKNIILTIKESLGMNDNAFDDFKIKVYKNLVPFMESLYQEVIFSDKEAFGYETIRTAFEMNLYGSARNVESMLFIHLYNKKRLKQAISDFKIEYDFKNCYYFEKEELKNSFRHFKDKRLYQMLFQILERTYVFNIGTNVALNKAKDIFECSESSIEKVLLENIAKVCSKTNKTDSNIYKNALYALREF